jgi:uncharacterized membrane protein HdeD (DUF308 family)
MKRSFSNYWWVFLVRGILALILGAIAVLMPLPTVTALVIYFGAWMLVDGIFSIIAGIKARKTTTSWGWMIFSGILSIILAVLVFINPFAATFAFVYLFAAWAFLAGVLEIVAAISLRKSIKGEGWYILLGIATIIFSILIFMNPLAGAVSLAFIFGVYAIVSAVMLISLAIRLKGRNRQSGGIQQTQPAMA